MPSSWSDWRRRSGPSRTSRSPGSFLHRDITPLVGHPATLRLAVRHLFHPIVDEPIDPVVGVEARGFIFGRPAAWELGVSFVPLRKQSGRIMCCAFLIELDALWGRERLGSYRMHSLLHH